MNRANRHHGFAEISAPAFRQLLRCFSLDLTAADTVRLTGLSLRSVNEIVIKLHQCIAECCEYESPFVVKADET